MWWLHVAVVVVVVSITMIVVITIIVIITIIVVTIIASAAFAAPTVTVIACIDNPDVIDAALCQGIHHGIGDGKVSGDCAFLEIDASLDLWRKDDACEVDVHKVGNPWHS